MFEGERKGEKAIAGRGNTLDRQYPRGNTLEAIPLTGKGDLERIVRLRIAHERRAML